MIEVVYAVGAEYVDLPSGFRMMVQKGSHWPVDDPVVLARPHLFSRDTRYGLFYSAEPEGYGEPEGAFDEVEQATSAPGEKRSARRS